MTRALVAGLVLILTGAAGGCASGSGDRAPRSTDWSPAPVTVQGMSVLSQSDATGLRLHTGSGAKTFLPGVNLGSSVPGRQPGEVGGIEAATYRTWFAQMGGLGIRLVRIYTLHPPAFYAELARYNQAHERTPLYLVQGAYLPDESYFEPGKTLYSPAVDQSFSRELEDLSAAVHGDLTRDPAPGKAGGTYDVDVSRWLASWIIGVEWDPQGVAQTDRKQAGAGYRPGRYFVATKDASPTERWITRHMDELATAEAARGTSVPIAAANWPTADPLEHPTEPIASEDAVSVDAMHMLPTSAWPGGTYASFHAYPYYPDFQRDEPGLDQTTWEDEPDRYAGYLLTLKEHFAGTMPLVISEFGVPASLGSAHIGTNGRDQGNHSEQDAMGIDASLMRMMAEKGISGAFVFSWEDEWFKRTWNTIEHQDPERRQLWHDPLTNEQYFGIVATDPDKVPDAAVEAIPASGALKYVYIWADHSWVHVEVTGRDGAPPDLEINADALPGATKIDYRFTVDTAASTAKAEVRRALDPIRLDTTGVYRPGAAAPWHDYALIINRSFADRSAEYEPVGDLVEGSWNPKDKDYDSLATWAVDDKHDTVRMRIPWSMLGLADPSSRSALGQGRPAPLVTIPGIVFDVTTQGSTERLDFTWPTWTRVSYTQRIKAGAAQLEKAYRDLAP